MQELNMVEVDEVGGGVSSDAVYGAAIGVAVTLVVTAGVITVPFWAGALALSSIASSGIAIYTAWNS